MNQTLTEKVLSAKVIYTPRKRSVSQEASLIILLANFLVEDCDSIIFLFAAFDFLVNSNF